MEGSSNRGCQFVWLGFITRGSLDWTKRGFVNPVRNQGKGSNCWIIPPVAAVEALYMIKNNGKNIKLSEQEIVDNYNYKPSEGNPLGKYGSTNGCFKYIKEHGISRSEDWAPYTGVRAELTEPKSKPNPQAAISITDYAKVREDQSVLAALDIQPLVGAMYVTKEFTDLKGEEIYRGGIPIADCMHAVLIVGYGTDEKTKKKYYKIQNSWGTDWGDDGYAKVERHEVHRISYPIDIK